MKINLTLCLGKQLQEVIALDDNVDKIMTKDKEFHFCRG